MAVSPAIAKRLQDAEALAKSARERARKIIENSTTEMKALKGKLSEVKKAQITEMLTALIAVSLGGSLGKIAVDKFIMPTVKANMPESTARIISIALRYVIPLGMVYYGFGRSKKSYIIGGIGILIIFGNILDVIQKMLGVTPEMAVAGAEVPETVDIETPDDIIDILAGLPPELDASVDGYLDSCEEGYVGIAPALIAALAPMIIKAATEHGPQIIDNFAENIKAMQKARHRKAGVTAPRYPGVKNRVRRGRAFRHAHRALPATPTRMPIPSADTLTRAGVPASVATTASEAMMDALLKASAESTTNPGAPNEQYHR